MADPYGLNPSAKELLDEFQLRKTLTMTRIKWAKQYYRNELSGDKLEAAYDDFLQQVRDGSN